MGRGEMEMALSDLQLIPEAMGNPYIGGIFQSADRNRDGYLDQQDVRGLMERLIQLRDPEAKHQRTGPGRCRRMLARAPGRGTQTALGLGLGVSAIRPPPGG